MPGPGHHQDSEGQTRPRIRTFAALRHRNFRLFWLGVVVSLLGGWMQQLASQWLVYRLTNSAFMLGLVGFLAAIPAAPLSLLAGPLVDRLPRRPLLIACQIGLFLPPVVVALLIWSGRIEVWHVIVAELLRGAVLAIDQPAKQTAIVDMTGKEDIGSAIGLWSSAINVTRVLGPAIGGVVVAAVGEGICFFANGVSYLAVFAALLAIRLPRPEQVEHRPSLAGSLVEGLKYLLGARLILVLAALYLVAALCVQPYQTLLTVFARDILATGAQGLGLLTAAAGAGAVVGALGAASLPRRWQWPFAAGASLALPLTVAGFAFSQSFVLSCALLVAVGGLLTATGAVVNTLILVGVKDEFRGRVMSLFLAAVMGAPRVGGLGAGWLAGLLGAPSALGIGAALSLVASLPLAWIVWKVGDGKAVPIP
jgi:MFS family permease